MGPPGLDLNMAWVYRQKTTFGLGYRVGESVIAQLKFKLGSLMLVGIIIQATGIALYHNSLMQVINVSIFAGIITLIILGSILIPVLKPVKV